jgi:mannose-1-phosphate guanylyltransferase
MKALLLAAGFGTRLRPITDTVPKCMVPIRGKPLLQYWFDLLFPEHVEQALINTHYLPQVVRDYVAASPWRDRVTLVHEDELLGTGGTVLANAGFFQGGPFLVAHADNLTDFDVTAFFDRHLHRPKGALITMMTFETDSPQSCGIVEEDSDGLVVAFHEKVANPPGNHANAAVYIFEPEVVAFMEALGKPVIDISTEVIPAFLGRIAAWHNHGYHRDIGTPESLRAAEGEFIPANRPR